MLNTNFEKPQEGKITKKIEEVTAQAPSLTYLVLAGAAMVASVGLYFSGKRQAAIFVGLWPLGMLSIGNYNKMVKLLGSDSKHKA